MSDYFTSAERAALDRAVVPAMRAGLAAEIVSAANAGAGTVLRRDPRGGWRRHGRVLVGIGALVVASATAAATGLFDRLPIRIPGITHVAEVPAPKPKRAFARIEKPREATGKPVALASVVAPDPAPMPLTPGQQWRERREARIAAGLPVARPLVQRAMIAKIRSLPPTERKAARAEWRRIKALPPEERKAAVAKVKADYLAAHPQIAKRYEQRLERRSMTAAAGAGEAVPPPPQPGLPQGAGPLGMGPRAQLTPEERAERRQRWQAMTPEERLQRRQQRQERRARRLQNMPVGGEGSPAPLR